MIEAMQQPLDQDGNSNVPTAHDAVFGEPVPPDPSDADAAHTPSAASEAGPGGPEAPPHRHPAIASGVDVLSRMVLDFDDPVAALEEGIEALAATLAERDQVAAEAAQARRADQLRADAHRADVEGALRHARWHRVGELVDLGYGLDTAIGIMRENEAEIRGRAMAVRRDADEAIYRYALANGYRPQPVPHLPAPSEAGAAPRRAETPQGDFARLAAMSEDEFARATEGDRWHRLHGRREAS